MTRGNRRAKPLSIRIALLSVFTSMAMLLEVFPIPGITDLKLVPQVPAFTIDWTGIPLSIIFFGLGFVSSLVGVAGVAVAIGYRNPVGAIFKVISESLTLTGMFFGFLVYRLVSRRCKVLENRKTQVLLVLVAGVLFRAVGMYFVNIVFLPIFVGVPQEIAFTVAAILVPWNALQAIINIVGGLAVMAFIPKEIMILAELSDSTSDEYQTSWELNDEEA